LKNKKGAGAVLAGWTGWWPALFFRRSKCNHDIHFDVIKQSEYTGIKHVQRQKL